MKITQLLWVKVWRKPKCFQIKKKEEQTEKLNPVLFNDIWGHLKFFWTIGKRTITASEIIRIQSKGHGKMIKSNLCDSFFAFVFKYYLHFSPITG